MATSTYSELNQVSIALLNIERVSDNQYLVIWRQENDRQARKILQDLKIKTKREQINQAGDWNYEMPSLCQVDTVFWVVAQKACEKLMASNGSVNMNLLLD